MLTKNLTIKIDGECMIEFMDKIYIFSMRLKLNLISYYYKLNL